MKEMSKKVSAVIRTRHKEFFSEMDSFISEYLLAMKKAPVPIQVEIQHNSKNIRL